MKLINKNAIVKTTSMKKKKGNALGEMLLYLGVASAIIGGSIYGYRSYQMHNIKEDFKAVASATMKGFQERGVFSSIDTDTLDSLRTQGYEIEHLYDADTDAYVNSQGGAITLAAGATNQKFDISMDGFKSWQVEQLKESFAASNGTAVKSSSADDGEIVITYGI